MRQCTEELQIVEQYADGGQGFKTAQGSCQGERVCSIDSPKRFLADGTTDVTKQLFKLPLLTDLTIGMISPSHSRMSTMDSSSGPFLLHWVSLCGTSHFGTWVSLDTKLL